MGVLSTGYCTTGSDGSSDRYGCFDYENNVVGY